MASIRGRNTLDILYGLRCRTLVSRFVSRMEEELEPKNSLVRKTKQVVFENNPGSEDIDMSPCRTAAWKELCFHPSIHNKDCFTSAVPSPLLQSPATQTTGAFKASQCRASGHPVPRLYQTFSDEVCRNASGCTERMYLYHLFHCKLDEWIGTVTQLFTEKGN